MKTLKILLFLILLGSIYFLYNQSQVTKTVEDMQTSELKYEDTEQKLTNKTKNSVTIEWHSEEKETGNIQYGILKGTYYSSRADIDATHTHSVTLSPLSECTKYYYRISPSSVLFDKEDGSFTTLCDKITK